MVRVFRVFGAEMVVSSQSSGVGPKAGIFRQFRTAQVGLETAFGWSYLCVVMLWTVPMNCQIFIGPCESILVLLP